MKQETALKIIQEVQAKHFEELRALQITPVFDKKSQDYYMAIRRSLTGYLLYVDQEALKFSEMAFRGCLAHELSHIVIIEQSKASVLTNLWKTFKAHLGFNTGLPQNADVESAEERSADQMAVEKGFGKDLLLFLDEHHRNYKAHNATEGLTKREIKKVIKTSGQRRSPGKQ